MCKLQERSAIIDGLCGVLKRHFAVRVRNGFCLMTSALSCSALALLFFSLSLLCCHTCPEKAHWDLPQWGLLFDRYIRQV